MTRLSRREASRRRNAEWNAIVEDAILRSNKEVHNRKVRARVINLLLWSAAFTSAFTAWAVVFS